MYLDADIVLKLCAYEAADELIQVSSIGEVTPAILAVSAFSLQSRIARSRNILNRDLVVCILRRTLQTLRRLEPNDDEIAVAADLEQRAIELGLELDTGESQIFAILMGRSAVSFITGDKRAVRALSVLANGVANCRVACLEQLLASVILIADIGRLRSRICSQRAVDRAVTASFACSSESASADLIMQGLRSYIADLRRDSGQLLIHSDDLSAVIP